MAAHWANTARTTSSSCQHTSLLITLKLLFLKVQVQYAIGGHLANTARTVSSPCHHTSLFITLQLILLKVLIQYAISAHWTAQIYKHKERSEEGSDLYPVTSESANTHKHNERSELCIVTLNLQIDKHSERDELCPVTLEPTNTQAQRVKQAIPIEPWTWNPQAQQVKRAVPSDPWIWKSLRTSSEASCAWWPMNLQIYKHSEWKELCSVAFDSANPQVQRAKRAVPSDFRIGKSKSTASEASCYQWPLNLQIHHHSERLELYLMSSEPAKHKDSEHSELCQLALKSANPQT